MSMARTDRDHAFMELKFLWEKTDNNQIYTISKKIVGKLNIHM